MIQRPPTDLAAEPPTPDRDRKGRVLFVGSSYYNNWYLSRELRRLGWVADTFVHGGEGADAFLHGSDYIIDRII